jgi:hypothetical protein
MPHDGDHLVTDEDSLEMQDLAAAKAEAQEALGQIAKDALPDSDQRTFVVSVRDEAEEVVARAALSLIVETKPQAPAS